MSKMSLHEKALLENLLKMSDGYVLDFTDESFGEFFYDQLNINIHDNKYQNNGTSKAKKLREFWRVESDHIVGKSIEDMIEYQETQYLINENGPSSNSINGKMYKQSVEKCKTIAKRLCSSVSPLDKLKQAVVDFDGPYLAEQINRMEQSIYTDPSLAIGTAKEVLETCCKTILYERGKPIKGNPDIPTLTKKTFQELKLVPDGIPQSARGSKVIKRLLSKLSTIGQDLAELRNLYGTGHGKHGTAKGLAPRHAKLAVGSVSTLTTFLYETHKETEVQ